MSDPILSPERRLMAAVLLQCIEDLSQTKKSSDKYKAISWFKSRETNHLYSFESICTHLGKRSDEVRRSIGLL